MNIVLDRIYDELYVKYKIAKDYLEGKISKDFYIDNFKVEEPEELLYGVYLAAASVYRVTEDNRFKNLMIEASEAYTESKSWKLPTFHI